MEWRPTWSSRESDLPYRAIPAAALRGRSPWTLARNAGTLARGTQMARRLIAAERPAAILGTGGYVCVPLFLAARAARRADSDLPARCRAWPGGALPGAAGDSGGVQRRRLGRYFDLRFAISDQDPQSKSKSKISMLVTGYPVRRELFEQDRAACRAAFDLADGLPTLLVYGGSRGARSINRAIAALLEHLLAFAQIIHVCGREGDELFLHEAAARLPGELRARYRLYPYLYSSKLRD